MSSITQSTTRRIACNCSLFDMLPFQTGENECVSEHVQSSVWKITSIWGRCRSRHFPLRRGGLVYEPSRPVYDSPIDLLGAAPQISPEAAMAISTDETLYNHYTRIALRHHSKFPKLLVFCILFRAVHKSGGERRSRSGDSMNIVNGDGIGQRKLTGCRKTAPDECP